MKSQKKIKMSNIIQNFRLLKPRQKLVVLKALQYNEPPTDKDLKVMEWAVGAIKSERANNRLLRNGLSILNKTIERQDKKS